MLSVRVWSRIYNACPCKAYRNYNYLGAGFNWETADWSKFQLWTGMADDRAPSLHETLCSVAGIFVVVVVVLVDEVAVGVVASVL